MMMKNLLLCLFVCALISVPTIVSAARDQPEVGTVAPDFQLTTNEGNQASLKDYRGKVVVIEFMRTDCPSCAKVTSALSDVKAKFGENIVVLSVVNQPDNQATVARYMARNKVAGPHCLCHVH